MIDPFGRVVDYARISVTDRCDLRCTYCMAEDTGFVPRAEILSLEEIARLGACLVRKGVKRIRLSGGEPLVRKGVIGLIEELGRLIGPGGLDELMLTTNGTRLAQHAAGLKTAGIRRVNVSLDSLDPDRFASITRGGRLGAVLDGIKEARAQGLAIRINTVALRGVNQADYDPLIAFCGEMGFDLCLIETMPLGETHTDRLQHYLPLSEARADIETAWTLEPVSYRSAGPASYCLVKETGRRIGFITPMSHDFCAACNRVRITCTGTMYMCLGRTASVDLRDALRGGASDRSLEAAIDAAIAAKPGGHDFTFASMPGSSPARTMNATGG